MPLGVFVPARWTDLSVDVHADTGTVAQGGVPYKGADAKWHGLGPGTSGQVLTSGGAAANPAWATPFSGAHSALTGLTAGDDHTQYLRNTPGTATRNLVIPANTTSRGIVLRSFSNVGDHSLAWQESGGAIKGWITSNGRLVIAAQPTTNSGNALGIRGNSTSLFTDSDANSSLFRVEQLGNASAFLLYGNAALTHVDGLFRTHIDNVSATGPAFTLRHDGTGPWFQLQGPGSNTEKFSVIFDTDAPKLKALNLNLRLETGAAANQIHIQGVASQSARLLAFCQVSSTSARRETAAIDAPFATATDASRKGRMTFHCFDATAAREFMRGETDGTNSMIGFLGAVASARVAITGSRGGNAALASLLTELAAKGLITDSTT